MPNGTQDENISAVVAAEIGSLQGTPDPGKRSLPAAGDLISATLIATVSRGDAAHFFAEIALPLVPACDVEIYKIAYLTRDECGALVNASGALAVPQTLGTPAPLLSYQHGTTTLSWKVASTAPAAGAPYRHLEALAFGTAGYLTVLPDYLGYGDSGHRFHPYLHAETLACTVVDLLKGARAFCAARQIALNGKLFLAGYSEGGYATMAATREIQENHPELAITASAPMAGPYDLSTSLKDVLNSDSYPGAGYLAFAFWAYDRVYSLNLLDQVIMPAFAAQLDLLFDGSHTLFDDDAPSLPNEIAALFREEFLADFLGNGLCSLKESIRENDLHAWTPTVPMRLIHSRSDEIVNFDNSLSALHHFNRNGATPLVQLVEPVQEGTHGDAALPALLVAKGWFDTLK